MDLKLKGKNAIITGGSAGIGFACAKALVEEGSNIMIIGRNQKQLEEAVEKLPKFSKNQDTTIIPISGDLSDANTANRIVDIAVSQFSSIDILINNAGSALAGSFLDLKDEDFLESWNLKLLGYIRMVRAVAPHMMQQRDGKIINIIGSAGRTPTQ